MKRFAAATVSLLMTFAFATVSTVAGPVSTASAAPPGPGVVYGGTGTGQILGLNATAVGLNLANVGVATTNASTSSTSTPRSRATSSNIAAAVVGLPVTVSRQTQTAPPDHTDPVTGGLPSVAVNLLLLQLRVNALQTSNLARWAGDTRCVAGNPAVLSDSQTTTGDASLTLAGTNLLTLAAADVRNTNALVNTATNVGANKAVRSTAVGTVANLKLLNDEVVVTVSSNPTLTATATGKTGGATVTSNANTVVVSVKIGTAAPVVVRAGTSLLIPGLGTLRVNNPVVGALAANGTSAAGSWDFLTLNVNLGLARATVKLLSLTAAAKAPIGGLDCAAVLEAPVIVTPAEGATTGRTPTISGTARPNATVKVTIDNGATLTTTANSSGVFSVVSPALTDGPHTAVAVQTVGGVTSPPSPVRHFTVATDIRTAPVITSPTSSAVPTNNARPTIRGTGVAGATLTVRDGTTVLGTTTVRANGTWTLVLTRDLIDGRHEFIATQAGGNGAASSESNHVIYVVDTVALAPRITNPPGLVRTPNNRRVIAGTSEANANVIVRKQSSIWCATKATAAGNWSCPAANVQPNGFALLTAVQTDTAGNVSPEADTRLVIVDTLPAGAPRITSPSPNSRGTVGTVYVTGTGAAGGQVTLLVDGREVGQVFMSLNGLWSIPTPKLAAGTHTFSAFQVDGTGNRSTMSTRVISTLAASTSGGYVVEFDRRIDKASYATGTVRLAGIGFPGSRVIVTDERGVRSATTTVAKAASGSRTGNWALVFPSSPDGIHRYTATQTTIVTGGGKTRTVTATSAPIQVRIDRASPPAPALVSPLSNEIQATTLPSFGGSAEPGVVVVATIDGRLIMPTNPRLQGAITDNDRRWVVRSSVSVGPGTHTLKLYAVDPAGNRSGTTTATLRTKMASG
ncbi:Ig-like domain-containing protein [Nakamurella sp. A5-74]|uniref:Ig-like domain-containing protein n=1 Tax=Nakamurella sp. A5-74 TaxID=3158264 RepID=A0AAU8DPH6_9ACTN